MACRDKYLASQVPALLLRGQLIFEVDSRRTRFDHLFHQLEHVKVSAKSGFPVRYYRDIPVRAVLSFGVIDLVRSLKRPIDPPHDLCTAVRRVQPKVGVAVSRQARVCGDLPSAYVDSLPSRLDHLDCLVTC